MTDLFEPLVQRGVTFKNRIGVSPMCMYCCGGDGKPTEATEATETPEIESPLDEGTS